MRFDALYVVLVKESLSLWFCNLNSSLSCTKISSKTEFMNNSERSFDRFSFFDLLNITKTTSDKKKSDSKNEEMGRKQSLKKSLSDAFKKSSEELEERKLRYKYQVTYLETTIKFYLELRNS